MKVFPWYSRLYMNCALLGYCIVVAVRHTNCKFDKMLYLIPDWVVQIFSKMDMIDCDNTNSLLQSTYLCSKTEWQIRKTNRNKRRVISLKTKILSYYET